MLGIERETGAAILQDEPHPLHGNARAEGIVDALNPTGDVAVFIHHGQVRRIAAHRVAGLYVAIRAMGIDLGGAFARVFLGKKLIDGRLVKCEDPRH